MGSENFQVGEHIRRLGEWHIQRRHGCSDPAPQPHTLPIHLFHLPGPALYLYYKLGIVYRALSWVLWAILVSYRIWGGGWLWDFPQTLCSHKYGGLELPLASEMGQFCGMELGPVRSAFTPGSKKQNWVELLVFSENWRIGVRNKTYTLVSAVWVKTGNNNWAECISTPDLYPW